MRPTTVFLAGALLSLSAAAQAPASAWNESPLDNDGLLILSKPAEEAFARGDRELVRLRGAAELGAQEVERAWTALLESWNEAVEVAAAGEGVRPDARSWVKDPSPWIDVDGTAERRSEGVEYALLRRLCAFDAGDRARWSARFEPLAEESLRAARGDAAKLARVERRWPATRSAALAALQECDRAFEAGRPSAARAWLERALRHHELSSQRHPDLVAALTLRVAVLEPRPKSGERADGASELVPLFEVELSDTGVRNTTQTPLGGGRQVGAQFLGDGRLVVWTAKHLTLIDIDAPKATRIFGPRDLALHLGRMPIGSVYNEHAPGWRLDPWIFGNSFGLTLSRSPVRTSSDYPRGWIAFDAPRRDAVEVEPPRTRWSLLDELLERADGSRLDASELLPAEDREPQQGPTVAADHLVVAVRRKEREETGQEWSKLASETWLAALDPLEGTPRWSRIVHQGVEGPIEHDSFAERSLRSMGSGPLASAGERVFIGTHTGAGALYDAVDGRLVWAISNRRRSAERPGWTGARPVVFPGGILWAPADGDSLLALRSEPDLDGQGVLLVPPRPIDDAVALVGGTPRAALVLTARAGERRAALWDLATGERRESFALSDDERWRSEGWCGARRALLVSDRALYLVDLERGLWLLDARPAPSGGRVVVRDDLVALVGDRRVLFFRAR